MAMCNLESGKTTFLWVDSCLHLQLPHLVYFSKRTDLAAEQVIHTEFLQDLFHLPLSLQDFQEFEQMEEICDNASIKVQLGNQDTWSYIWGNSDFLSQHAYKIMVGHQPAPQMISWLWNSSCQAKQNSSFGFYCMIVLTQGTCLAGKFSFCHLACVPLFNVIRKKPWFICLVLSFCRQLLGLHLSTKS
jgi:hypothetical protein